jgi:hypothetical protein
MILQAEAGRGQRQRQRQGQRQGRAACQLAGMIDMWDFGIGSLRVASACERGPPVCSNCVRRATRGCTASQSSFWFHPGLWLVSGAGSAGGQILRLGSGEGEGVVGAGGKGSPRIKDVAVAACSLQLALSTVEQSPEIKSPLQTQRPNCKCVNPCPAISSHPYLRASRRAH